MPNCAKMQQNEAFNTVIFIVNVNYYMSMIANTANNDISTSILQFFCVMYTQHVFTNYCEKNFTLFVAKCCNVLYFCKDKIVLYTSFRAVTRMATSKARSAAARKAARTRKRNAELKAVARKKTSARTRRRATAKSAVSRPARRSPARRSPARSSARRSPARKTARRAASRRAPARRPSRRRR